MCIYMCGCVCVPECAFVFVKYARTHTHAQTPYTTEINVPNSCLSLCVLFFVL